MMKSFLLLGALAVTAVNMNAQTTLLNETFTVSANDGSLPSGWSSPDTDQPWFSSVTDSSSLTDNIGFSGQVAVSALDPSTNPVDLLISPAINLPAGGASTLSLKVGTITFSVLSGNPHYAIYAIPATSTFTGNEAPILEETIATNDVAIAKTISLASFAGQNIKLYFKHFNSSAYYLLIDDVKVTAPTVLGTAETLTKAQVGIYPNPAADFISVKTTSDIVSTEIYDMGGRKVESQQKGNTVDVRNLQPGNYILNVNTKEGKSSAKFIKK